MGRKVSGPPPGDVRKYVPEAYGNREDPDPVVIWIKAPTELEKRRLDAGPEPVAFARDEHGNVRKGDDGGPLITLDLRQIIGRQVEAVALFVTRVDNYTGADGEPIDDGAELSVHGEAEFVAEAYLEVKRSLSLSDDPETGEKKDSSEPSTSTPLVTSRDGIVKSASMTGKPKKETASTARGTPGSSPSLPMV